MATFLFWNLQKKPLGDSLYKLCETHRVDVLILAECAMSPAQVLLALNPTREQTHYEFPFSGREKLRIFTRFSPRFLQPRKEPPRWTIRELLLPGLPSLILVGVHLHSKANWCDASQTAECTDLRRDILEIEEQLGHRRTLVVGDFNMNPFDEGLISAVGLHGEPSRILAAKHHRTVNEEERSYFFNPMWNFFGDETRGPAGTYYYGAAELVRLSWNIFDQVLIRPDLLPYFRIQDLEILTGDGHRTFLTSENRVPGANGSSDHLPILFKLNL